MKPKILYDTKFLQLKETTSPKGNRWFYSHRPNATAAVVIAPVLHKEDGKYLIFLETRRPPLYAEQKADFCIEFPAGLVGDENPKETITDAINKELMEETGYKAAHINITSPLVTASAGLTSEISVLAIADVLDLTQYQKPVDDGGVIFKRHEIKIEESAKWLEQQQNSGKAISASVYGLLFFVMQNN